MATSARLRLREVRALFRMLGECCELGADPLAWRQHFAEQLPTLVGGQIGLIGEFQIVAPPFGKPFWLRPVSMVDYGWATASDRKPWEEHIEQGRPEEGPHITPDLLQRRLKIVHWSGHLGRSNWLRSEYFNLFVKQTKVDDGIFAHQQLAPGILCWMFVNRALGDKPFDARQRRLMGLMNGELARLMGTKLATSSEISATGLPPRLREVLIRLMQGDSEKQIAARLALSPHTVHDYVKRLHARFRVQSRGELLARCRNYGPVLELLANAQGGSRGSDSPPGPARRNICSAPVPGNGTRRCLHEDEGG